MWKEDEMLQRHEAQAIIPEEPNIDWQESAADGPHEREGGQGKA